MVTVTTAIADEGKSKSWSGHLISRNETHVSISVKGRVVNIPRNQCDRVELSQME